jgi:putative PIN family toxin of toxin-antitoxin system
MQKIILDTNVLVSSLIQRSYPYLILNEIFARNKIELCVSNALMFENYEVLKRKKFSKYPDFLLKAEILLADIERKATFHYPKITLQIIKDSADNRLLELAVASRAYFLVTGNTNDFTMNNFKGTKIISPKDYYEVCGLF